MTLRRRPRAPQRGVSLIEAVVALAVMGIGTLAVLGVQTSLRFNADIAKQRSEAVRIAQEAMEAARRFGTLAAYEAVVDSGPNLVNGLTTNTVYEVTRTVEEPVGLHAGRYKTVVVTVDWADRTGQAQGLELRSTVHGTPPALAGSLVIATDTGPARTPRRRHFAIPPDAVDQQDGTSRFAPPGAPAGLQWVFDNVSGFVTEQCLGAACTPLDARLLAGFVRFATGPAQPLPAQAALPADPPPPAPIDVVVWRTQPIVDPVGSPVPCFERVDATAVAYFCAVPVGLAGTWSGRSELLASPPTLDFAASVSDADATKYRVCRYTPYRDHRAVGTGTPPMRNDQHPLDYDRVAQSLTQQNFLLIRAGDGTTPFDCPADDATLPVNTNTWHHQPAN